MALLGPVTFLPLFLQVVDGASPVESGLRMLPLMLGVPVASITSGQIISRWGRYRVFPIVGTAMMAVGLALLARMDEHTGVLTASFSMAALGLGLGMVMQVLVLAVQNAVDYRDLGTATSGVTFFRAMGGVFGVALFGAIFAHQLDDQLATLAAGQPLPPAIEAHALEPRTGELTHLPDVLRSKLAHAYAAALQPVFLAALPFVLVGFGFTWRLKEIPLRETERASDPGEGLGMPVHCRSSQEIERILCRFVSRQSRQAIYEQLAARAGVVLPPIDCWLLFRIDETPHATVEELSNAFPVTPHTLDQLLAGLAARGLVSLESRHGRSPRRYILLTEDGRDTLERLARARHDQLVSLMRDWAPEKHAELSDLLRRLARMLVPDIETPRA
jgi:DNA-binding MarR family transcriptional regulator